MKKQKFVFRLLPIVSIILLTFASQQFVPCVFAADKVEEDLPMPPPAVDDADSLKADAAPGADNKPLQPAIGENSDNAFLPANKDKVPEDVKAPPSHEPEESAFLPAPKADTEASPQEELSTVVAKENSDLPADYSQTSLESSTTYKLGGEMDRPAFSLLAGYGSKSYNTTLVPNWVNAVDVLFDVRVLRLGPLFSLHGNLGFYWASLGNVGTALQVSDFSTRMGVSAQYDVNRKFALIGGVYRRTSVIKTLVKPAAGRDNDLQGLILQKPKYNPGIGAQYDFYIIPHGSLGIRAYAEMNYYTISLAVALEPVPRKRSLINYGFED